jgi:soluble lytic murein transglycosylase-like protein
MKTLLAILTLLCACGWAAATPRDAAESDLRRLLEQEVAASFADEFDATVWLMDMSARLAPFITNEDERREILETVHREATASNLKPDLVLALIQVESRFDRFAVSSVGAQGLMQIMPFWKTEIGRPNDNLTDIATNIRYGCRILQFYLHKEKGNLTRALARYNGSIGKTWYPNLVFGAWQKRWLAGDL